jgi:lipopolysaccharide export LptBFGC system permease protein LptF
VPAGAVVKGRDGRVYIRDKDSAANVANYEKYKSELFRAEGKPNVSDPKLQGFIDKLYKDNAKIGNGSTADAVRYELQTGESVRGRYHSQKAQNSIRYLEKWLKNNPNAKPSDKLKVEHLIKDMKDALNGK